MSMIKTDVNPTPVFCQGTLYLENNQRNVLHVGGIIETRIDVQFCVDTAGGGTHILCRYSPGGHSHKSDGGAPTDTSNQRVISDNFLQIKEGGRCYWV